MLSVSNSPSESVQYLTSPSQKQEAKNTAHNRFKYGSPKLRDVLRQKCRIRMKQQRNENFVRKRNLMEDDRFTFKDLIKQGISELEADLRLQELIYEEMVTELDNWLVEDMDYLIDLETEEVICPICQNKCLNQDVEMVFCDCGFRTKDFSDLSKLADQIKLKILEHELKCPSELSFYAEPKSNDTSTLNAICMNCEFWTTVL